LTNVKGVLGGVSTIRRARRRHHGDGAASVHGGPEPWADRRGNWGL